jgi:hypothetical protein
MALGLLMAMSRTQEVSRLKPLFQSLETGQNLTGFGSRVRDLAWLKSGQKAVCT